MVKPELADRLGPSSGEAERILDVFVLLRRKQAAFVFLVSITELAIFYLPLSGSQIPPGQVNTDSEYRRDKQVLKLVRSIHFSCSCAT